MRYKPRTAIKGQVLANFVAEFAPENSNTIIEEKHIKGTERTQEEKGWALYVDGVANSRGSGLGVVLISPVGELLEQAIRLSSAPQTMKPNTKYSCTASKSLKGSALIPSPYIATPN